MAKKDETKKKTSAKKTDVKKVEKKKATKKADTTKKAKSVDAIKKDTSSTKTADNTMKDFSKEHQKVISENVEKVVKENKVKDDKKKKDNKTLINGIIIGLVAGLIIGALCFCKSTSKADKSLVIDYLEDANVTFTIPYNWNYIDEEALFVNQDENDKMHSCGLFYYAENFTEDGWAPIVEDVKTNIENYKELDEHRLMLIEDDQTTGRTYYNTLLYSPEKETLFEVVFYDVDEETAIKIAKTIK